MNAERVQCFAAACCPPEANLGFQTAVVHASVSNVGKVAQTRAAIRAFHDWNGVQHRGVAGVTCLGRDAGCERDFLSDTPTGSGRMGYA